MTRHLVSGLALVVLSFVSPSPASAAATPGGPAVYDTIDAVEVSGARITLTGIIAGQTVPTERFYTISDGSFQGGSTISSSPAAAARCDRLAMLAMVKPGKYQFATTQIGSFFGCKLIVRAP
jgi:hypothetical protein